jgi:hypothetical protein
MGSGYFYTNMFFNDKKYKYIFSNASRDDFWFLTEKNESSILLTFCQQ